MSRIRSTDTKPEQLVRKFLFANGFRYRLHEKKLFGKPDIVLPKYKTVIFVNGCFWHGHKRCKASKIPASNINYWTEKIRRNIERDFKNKRKLKKLGWNVIEVWECKMRNVNEKEKTFDKLLLKLSFKSNG